MIIIVIVLLLINIQIPTLNSFVLYSNDCMNRYKYLTADIVNFYDKWLNFKNVDNLLTYFVWCPRRSAD